METSAKIMNRQITQMIGSYKFMGGLFPSLPQLEDKMEKVILKLKPVDWEKIWYDDDTSFLVIQQLPIETHRILIENYIRDYFGDEAIYINYLKAEYALKLGVLDYCTTINIDNMNIDEIIGSGLWDLVESSLPFIYELRSDIETIVSNIKAEMTLQRSISGSLERIEKAITEFLGNVSDMDLSVEGIQEILKSLGKEKEDIDKIINPSAV